MKDISNSLRILRVARSNYLKMIQAHSLEALNFIPEGFNNNIIWNFGHVIATQQLLTYALSGLPTPMDEKLIGKYRKGTKPTDAISQSELNELVSLSTSLIDQFEKDYNANLFQNYKVYKTSFGHEIISIDDAVEFNNLHEGMHLGTCIDIRRFINE